MTEVACGQQDAGQSAILIAVDGFAAFGELSPTSGDCQEQADEEFYLALTEVTGAVF